MLGVYSCLWFYVCMVWLDRDKCSFGRKWLWLDRDKRSFGRKWIYMVWLDYYRDKCSFGRKWLYMVWLDRDKFSFGRKSLYMVCLDYYRDKCSFGRKWLWLDRDKCSFGRIWFMYIYVLLNALSCRLAVRACCYCLFGGWRGGGGGGDEGGDWFKHEDELCCESVALMFNSWDLTCFDLRYICVQSFEMIPDDIYWQDLFFVHFRLCWSGFF